MHLSYQILANSPMSSNVIFSPSDVAIKQVDWDASKVHEKLRRDIEAHAESVRSKKLTERRNDYEGTGRGSGTVLREGGLVKAGLDVARIWLDGNETLVNTNTGSTCRTFSQPIRGLEPRRNLVSSQSLMRKLERYIYSLGQIVLILECLQCLPTQQFQTQDCFWHNTNDFERLCKTCIGGETLNLVFCVGGWRFDQLTLDSLYDDAIRRANQPTSYNPWEMLPASSPYLQPMVHDPFYALNSVVASHHV